MRNALAVLAGVVQAQVPHWIQCPLNGHTYAVLPATSWAQVEQFAVGMGGHLAGVRSAAENDWLIQTFASSFADDTRIRIGLTDALAEGNWTWTWTSGESLTFTAWGLFEPDNSGDQDFGALWRIPVGVGGGWGWADSGDGVAYAAMIELSQAAPAAGYASFGSGCHGSTGIAPTLDGVAREPPRIGSTTRVVVSNLPSVVTVPIFVLGLSNTDASGSASYPLPFDLGVLGWQGCPQLVSLDATACAITTTGHAESLIPIPNVASIAGCEFFMQALVLYHPSGVAVSNGLVATVGY